MKALTYHGSKDVRYETVKDPQLQNEEGHHHQGNCYCYMRIRPSYLSWKDS